MLAKTWDESIDPTGMMMSEKLDGMRAYWKSKKRKMYSRDGNEIFIPSWFSKQLPDFDMDGELWTGRDNFQTTVSIVRRQEPDERWKDVTYMVFDAPESKGTFKERYKFLLEWNRRSRPPNIKVLEHVTCKGYDHLRKFHDSLFAAGAEGVMLRDPDSKYEHKRSGTLLKVKRSRDADALVIGYLPGKGKYTGDVGALLCRLPNGGTVKLGSGLTDADRRNPPKINSVVTFKYQDLSDEGNPRFPRFDRVRKDRTWADISSEKLGTSKLKPVKPRAKPMPRTVLVKAPSSSKPLKGTPTRVAKHRLSPKQTVPLKKPSVGYSYRYELVDPSVNAIKFWEIDVVGKKQVTRWGKIGKEGQSLELSFASVEEAMLDGDRRRRGKEKKGYKIARAGKL